MLSRHHPSRFICSMSLMVSSLLSLTSETDAQVNFELLREGQSVIDDFFDPGSSHYFGPTLNDATTRESINQILEYCERIRESDQQRCLNEVLITRVTKPLEERLARLARRYPSIDLSVNPHYETETRWVLARGATTGIISTTGIYAACIYATTPVVNSLWAALVAWWYGTTAVGTLGAAMLAGPVGWVVTAGALVTAGVTYWYYESDQDDQLMRFRRRFGNQLRSSRPKVINKWTQFVKRTSIRQ